MIVNTKTATTTLTIKWYLSKHKYIHRKTDLVANRKTSRQTQTVRQIDICVMRITLQANRLKINKQMTFWKSKLNINTPTVLIVLAKSQTRNHTIPFKETKTKFKIHKRTSMGGGGWFTNQQICLCVLAKTLQLMLNTLTCM